jgi:site-specific recombinase XerD
MNIEIFINPYLESRGSELSVDTKESYIYRLQLFSDFAKIKNKADVSLIDSEFISSYILSINQNERYSENTRYMVLNEIKRFLNYLFEHSLLFVDFSKNITLPKWKRKKRVELSQAQKIEILNAISIETIIGLRNKTIVSFFLFENLRNTEISKLHVIDIDTLNKEIWVKSKQRVIKLSEVTWNLLHSYLNKRFQLCPKVENLFTTSKGGRALGSQSVRLRLKEALKEIQLYEY